MNEGQIEAIIKTELEKDYLSGEEKQILKLFYLEGVSCGDIGDRIGVKALTVGTWKKKALQKVVEASALSLDKDTAPEVKKDNSRLYSWQTKRNDIITEVRAMILGGQLRKSDNVFVGSCPKCGGSNYIYSMRTPEFTNCYDCDYGIGRFDQ